MRKPNQDRKDGAFVRICNGKERFRNLTIPGLLRVAAILWMKEIALGLLNDSNPREILYPVPTELS